jgi:putative heme-binding domain-containing protein
LTKLSASELVKLHTHPNEWFVRQARRQLADRAGTGTDLKDAAALLRTMYDSETDGVMRLHALWSLQVIGALDEPFLVAQLKSDNEHIRVWALRLLTDLWPLDTFNSQRPAGRAEAHTGKLLPLFTGMARDDKSGLVRLALSSLLQRLPIADRPTLAAALVSHAEDAQDHNLPFMIWYGLIPVGDQNPAALPAVAARCELPLTRKFIARRLAEDIEKNPAPLNDLLTLAAASKSSSLHGDILAGLNDGLKGWRKANKPAAWDDFAKAAAASTDDIKIASSEPKVAEAPSALSLLRRFNIFFGDAGALDAMKQQALDTKLALETRQIALQTVIDSNPPDLKSLCESLLKSPGLNAIAARGLATLSDPSIAPKLVDAYADFAANDRPQLVAALVSRAAFTAPLLEAVAAGRIPRNDITPFHARQIRGFNDAKLTARLNDVWGGLRDSTPDKQKRITELKARLTPAVLAKADKKQGQVLFNAVCGACHTLNGAGGKIGPDLTGSGRDNLDYLLMNIVDPSAAIAADYRMVTATLKDGRVLGGILSAQTDRTVTVRMLTETTTVERSDIAKLDEAPISMMPEGLLDALPEATMRDLIAYLMDKGSH